MVVKALVTGAAAVAAVASLPVFQDERVAPVAVKGDRLAIAATDCAPDCAAFAAISAGRWITIERQAGEANSVLIRTPVADLAAAEVISQIFPGASRTD